MKNFVKSFGSCVFWKRLPGSSDIFRWLSGKSSLPNFQTEYLLVCLQMKQHWTIYGVWLHSYK